MFAITLSALVVLVSKKLKLIINYFSNKPVPEGLSITGTFFLLIIALMLFGVAVSLVYQAVMSFKKIK